MSKNSEERKVRKPEKLVFQHMKPGDSEEAKVISGLKSGALALTKDEVARLKNQDTNDEASMAKFVEEVADRLVRGKTSKDGKSLGSWDVRAHEHLHIDEVSGQLHPGLKVDCKRCVKNAKRVKPSIEVSDAADEGKIIKDEPTQDVEDEAEKKSNIEGGTIDAKR